MRFPLLSLVTVAAALVSVRASASPNFPAAMEGDLMLSYPPACTICHVGTPGPTTATTPFAEWLIAHGLVAYDTASLSAALAALQTAKVSSAGDGISDIQKLQNGEDPNVPLPTDGGALPSAFPPPDYGCAFERRFPSESPLAFAVLLGMVVARRRHSRTRRERCFR